MFTLNLSYPDNSEIKFEARKYPDGQQDIILDLKTIRKDCYSVTIVSRFNSFNDLELIICATAAIRNHGIEDVTLYIPYLLGARSDRKFVDGSVSYLVQIVAPILNAQKYKKVMCLDVHSNIAAACIYNLAVTSNIGFVSQILSEQSNFILVSPDAGSKEKVYNVARKINYSDDIIVCSKRRDIKTGKIIATDIGNVVDLRGRDTFIIDDICDGGRTFIEIANKLKQINPGKINLIVTHGIFSNGYDELSRYFDKIYCTNSVKDINSNLVVKQTKII